MPTTDQKLSPEQSRSQISASGPRKSTETGAARSERLIQRSFELWAEEVLGPNRAPDELGSFTGYGVPGLSAIKKFADPKEEVGLRGCALRTLGLFRDDSMLPLLQAALNDTNSVIRNSALRGLSNLGTNNAAQILKAYMERGSPLVGWRLGSEDSPYEALALIPGEENKSFLIQKVLEGKRGSAGGFQNLSLTASEIGSFINVFSGRNSEAKQSVTEALILAKPRELIDQMLLDALSTATHAARPHLIEVIGGRRTPTAESRILDLKDNADWSHQAASIEALSKVGTALSVPYLERLVVTSAQKNESWIVKSAIEALLYQGTAEGDEAIRRLAAPTNEYVAERVIGALSTFPRPDLLPILEGFLQPGVKSKIQINALRAISRVENDTARKILTDTAVNHPDANIRLRAIQSIENSKDPDVANFLRKIATESADPQIKLSAVEALEGQDPALTLAVITDALRVSDSKTQELGLQTLRRIAHYLTPEARRSLVSPVRDLIPQKNGLDPAILAKTISILPSPSSKELGEELIRFADSENLGKILQNLSPLNALELFERYSRNESPEIRRIVAKCLSFSLDFNTGARRLLSTMAEDKDPEVKQIANNSLTALRKPKEAVKTEVKDEPEKTRTALERVQTGDWNDRELAIRQLTDAGDVSAIPLLLGVLKERDPRLSLVAANAILSLGKEADDKSAVAVARATYESAIQSEDYLVTRLAGRELGELDEPWVIPTLLKQLYNTNNVYLRKSSEAALKSQFNRLNTTSTYQEFLLSELRKDKSPEATNYARILKKAFHQEILSASQIAPKQLRTLVERTDPKHFPPQKDKPTLVVFISPEDHNGAFSTAYSAIEPFVNAGYQIVWREVVQDTGTDDLKGYIRESERLVTQGVQAKAILTMFHGSKTRSALGGPDPRLFDVTDETRQLDMYDIGKFKGSSAGKLLAPGGTVHSISCSNGEGRQFEKNMGEFYRRVYPQARRGGIQTSTVPMNAYGAELDHLGSPIRVNYTSGIESEYWTDLILPKLPGRTAMNSSEG